MHLHSRGRTLWRVGRSGNLWAMGATNLHLQGWPAVQSLPELLVWSLASAHITANEFAIFLKKAKQPNLSYITFAVDTCCPLEGGRNRGGG